MEMSNSYWSITKQATSSYRPGCWQISDELSGSISQVHKTVQKAIKNLETKIEIKNKSGDLTGETVFLYQPKSYVVIRNLNEFSTENGIKRR